MRNENNCRRVVSLKLNFLLFLFCGEGAIFLNLVRVEFESDDEIRPALCCEIGGLILFDFDAVALITRGRACVCVWCGVGPFRPADDMEVQGIGRREDDFVGGRDMLR